MSITTESELAGMKKASEAVAFALKEMRNFAQPGRTTKELDDFGGQILADLGAKSAPRLTYGFPGWTCISLNNEFCHGIPSEKEHLQKEIWSILMFQQNSAAFGLITGDPLFSDRIRASTKNLWKPRDRFCIRPSIA